jgi:hypothetical protein
MKKLFLLGLFCSLTLFTCKTYKKATSIEEAINRYNRSSEPLLGFPFGTILELKVEVIDSWEYIHKGPRTGYLMRVLEVNNKPLEDIIVLSFDDGCCSDDFPSTHFELYKKHFGKEVKDGLGLGSPEHNEMNKTYLGIYNIAAYESGKYIGVPNDYSKYAVAPQGIGFTFTSYIQIITKLEE